VNAFDYDYINSFGFIIKGGIIRSIEELLKKKNVLKIENDAKGDGIKYYLVNNSNYHFLSGIHYLLCAEKVPKLFPQKMLNGQNFVKIKAEIDNIRKALDINAIKKFEWENLIYIENIQFDLTKNLQYNITILKEYLSQKIPSRNEIDCIINNAWKRFFNYSYMEKYNIPTIEKYEYWKSLGEENKSFHDTYKDYKN
jgi:hypothetical protein